MDLSDKQWNDWLQGNAGQALLSTCAKRIVGAAPHRKLVSSILDLELDGYAGGRIAPPDHNSLMGELYIFVSTRPQVRSVLAENIFQNNHLKAAAILCRAFIQYLQGIRSASSKYHWHAYYHKARRTIRAGAASHGDIVYHAEREGSFFAIGQPADPLPPLAPEHLFSTTDFTGWPHPDLADNADTPAVLLAWARFFHEIACRQIGSHHLVPIREMINYILARGGLGWKTATHIPLPDSGAGEHSLPVTLQAPDLPSLEQIKALAEGIFEGWSASQQQAFCMRFHQEHSLKEIARRLDYASPSGPHALLHNLTQSLLETLAAWPGLSPPDLDDTCWGEFFAALMAFCKTEELSRI